jgi:transposase-like protein
MGFMKCPRCGSEAEKTGKTWKFSFFNVWQYYCDECQKKFSASYKRGIFSHTTPKSKK